MKSIEIKSICVIGLGYVGLPTAAIFASNGIKVLGVDVNQKTVTLINEGKTHIIEPDLDELVKNTVLSGNFRASFKPEPADAFIIAVPTPFLENHEPNLNYVKDAITSLAGVLRKGNLVIIESTCPVGTTEKASNWLAEMRDDLVFPSATTKQADIFMAHSPERVLPGNILSELISNDRVIGGVSKQCAEQTMLLYKLIVKGKCLLTNARTAELVKLTENAFRDVNIAFANEVSLICDHLNINPWKAISLANHHPRVNILSPGPGVGGHCIAVDPWFIVHSAPAATPLIQAARNVNDTKSDIIIQKIVKIANTIANPKIACFGLSYKGNIGDLRESPALKIVIALAEFSQFEILIVEPYIEKIPLQFLNHPNAKLLNTEEALNQAELVILLTDHAEFRQIDRTKLSEKILFDTRGIWAKDEYNEIPE